MQQSILMRASSVDKLSLNRVVSICIQVLRRASRTIAFLRHACGWIT
jgi:hypothetical protein